MASSRLTSLALLLAAGVVAAQPQAPARVRGTVAAFDGKVLAVQSLGKRVEIQLGDKTEIVRTQPIQLADIKPGDFLGVTSARGAGGALTAIEIRRFPKPLNPGHRPFDGRDDQTMTNATVAATAQSTSGRELTMTYEGGSQKILVPASASISTLVPATSADLVPGATVNLTAAGEKLTALRIQVSRP